MQVTGKSYISFIDIGDSVICDWCNDDYTGCDHTGGSIIGTDAVCPKCTIEAVRKGAKPEVICPPNLSFKEFILKVRNGNNFIAIQTFDN